ncbi:hypothetical protein ACFOGI_13610 [Virgibacillus xinjiangensis]|uniref:Uncharacterized protein n=1 Tax=Virgibacillus xinjiangensis TaxID=393090 RepID=A0ABV7CZ78_9BACI
MLLMMGLALLLLLSQLPAERDQLSDLISNKAGEISEVSISLPGTGEYHRTDDRMLVQEVEEYLQTLDYVVISREPYYIPMKAGMIFLHGDRGVDFFVLFDGTDIMMVNHHYYSLENTPIDEQWIRQMYACME